MNFALVVGDELVGAKMAPWPLEIKQCRIDWRHYVLSLSGKIQAFDSVGRGAELSA
jgi:hypothetical protein